MRFPSCKKPASVVNVNTCGRKYCNLLVGLLLPILIKPEEHLRSNAHFLSDSQICIICNFSNWFFGDRGCSRSCERVNFSAAETCGAYSSKTPRRPEPSLILLIYLIRKSNRLPERVRTRTSRISGQEEAHSLREPGKRHRSQRLID